VLIRCRHIFLVMFLAACVAACGGSGGGTGGAGANSGGDANSGNPQISLTCDASATNPYAGCFVSNNCVSAAGATNYSNITLQFMNDGSLLQSVRIYTTANCTGSVVSSYTLPATQTYTVLQPQLSATGQAGQFLQVATGITGVSQLASGYTLASLNNNQLCFSQNDYSWTPSGGGFQPLATAETAVNLTLNLTDCLRRM